MSVICTRLERLRRDIRNERELVIDFETTGLDFRTAYIVGAGFKLPNVGRSYYINIRHLAHDKRFQRYSENDLMEVTADFVRGPPNILIMHNASFDLQFLLRNGLTDIRARVVDTMVWAHRCNENFRERKEGGTFTLLPLYTGYGLKFLTAHIFGEQPPTLSDVCGSNILSSPIAPTAAYCVLDVNNTYRLYKHFQQIIESDPDLERLTHDIDDAVAVPLAKMIHNGFYVDQLLIREAESQGQEVIAKCNQLIFELTKWNLATANKERLIRYIQELLWPLETPSHPLLESDCEDLRRDDLVSLLDICPENLKVPIAALVEREYVKTRLSGVFKSLKSEDEHRVFRRLSSLSATGRYACNPNLHSLPGKRDKGSLRANALEVLPEECRFEIKARKVLKAKEGFRLIAFDLKAAEPRYLGIHLQKLLKEPGDPARRDGAIQRDKIRNKFRNLYNLMRATRIPYDGTPVENIKPDIPDDPLWLVFRRGLDPYNAMLEVMLPDEYSAALRNSQAAHWFSKNRHIGKLALLALVYGASAKSLSAKLRWTVERTEQALLNIHRSYPMIAYAQDMALRSLAYTGIVRSLWGRPRRINGYYDLLNSFEPIFVEFCRKGDNGWLRYEAEIIVLGAFRQGVQAFCRKVVVEDSYGRRHIVLEADMSGQITCIDRNDVFVKAGHYNTVPFRNISYRSLRYVLSSSGRYSHLGRQESCIRAGFNAIFQSSGADHLRWIICNMDREVAPLFPGVDLFLTVHDSLEYYCPESQVENFIQAALPVIQRRPPFSNGIDFEVECEVGQNFADMVAYELEEETHDQGWLRKTALLVLRGIRSCCRGICKNYSAKFKRWKN